MRKDYSKISSLPFKVRAVQLDLARHYEKPAYIKEYMAFCAESGFNTAVLYLEGRIKTKSFPFGVKASYSPEEISGMVERAKELGLDLIPVVSSMGHAEHFFESGHLKHLSEERGGKFRFSPGVSTFCPSLEETRDFLRGYLTEISALFPGPNFHAGFDEAWNLGLCDVCSEKVRGRGLGKLFMEHLKFIHGVLAENGKRVWIWDDLFEFFPEELENVPKDIVMAHWCYNESIDHDGIKCHFANGIHRDWLDLYESLGLDAVICPWAIHKRNTETFTDYGRRRNILGGLQTQWEGTPRRNPAQNKLLVSFTGKLWGAKDFDPERAWSEALRLTFKSGGPVFQSGVSLISSRHTPEGRSDIKSYLRGPLSEPERARREALREGLALIKGKGAPVFESCAALSLLHLELRGLLCEIYDPRRPDTDTPRLREKLLGLQNLHAALRDGVKQEVLSGEFSVDEDAAMFKTPNAVAGLMDAALKRLDNEFGPSDMLLKARFFLKDYYGLPKLRITVFDAGGDETSVAEGVFKSYELHETGGFYDCYFPFEARSAPAKLRIEHSGYGGQGLAYFEIQSRHSAFAPSGVSLLSGTARDLEAVLKDDYSFAYLGNPDTLAAIHNSALAGEKTAAEFSLSEKTP